MIPLKITTGIIFVALFTVLFILGCTADNNVPDAGTVQRDTSAPSDSTSGTRTLPAGEVKGANVTHVCLKIKPLVEELYSQSFQIPDLTDPYDTGESCRIYNGFPGRGLSSGQTQIGLLLKKDAKYSLTGEGCDTSYTSWDKLREVRVERDSTHPEVQGPSLTGASNYYYQERVGYQAILTFQTPDQCVYKIEVTSDPASTAASLDNLGQLAPAIVSAVIENANSR